MKKLEKILLSVKANKWRMDDLDVKEADEEFKEARLAALKRDEYTCRFCGFRAMKYQEVHHLNDDHSDNRVENLITACSFCHMCAHIGLAGKNQEAKLIWLPEIEQAELNNLMRVLYYSLHWVKKTTAITTRQHTTLISSIRDTTNSLQASFSNREEACIRILGTSDPLELGNAMQYMPDEIYAQRGETLKGIRLLPAGKKISNGKDVLPDMFDAWEKSGGPFSACAPSLWASLKRNYIGDGNVR